MNAELLSRAIERAKASPRARGHVGEIEAILRGQRSLNAGIAIEVERAAKGRKAPNGEEYHVKIRASTEHVARDAGIIPMEAWMDGGLTNFVRNPVILAYHQHNQPIGISVHTEIDTLSRSMVQYWLFHEESDVSRMMKSLYERGFMRAASVGFIVKDFEVLDEKAEKRLQDELGTRDPIFWRALEAELLETSAVPVPADAYALSVEHAVTNGRAAGIDIRPLRMLTSQEPAMENEEITPEAEAPVVEERAVAAPSVEERLAAVEAQLASLAERLTAETSANDSGAGAAPEEPIVTSDEGETRTASDTPADAAAEPKVEIPKREGETDEQAVARYVDELVANALGAPVAK